jgi:hypothetical protein
MKPRETRKSLKELTRSCAANGIDLIVESPRGGGSHFSIIFRGQATVESIRVTIVAGGTISPGVQRNWKRYVASLVGKISIAEIICKILENIFGN